MIYILQIMPHKIVYYIQGSNNEYIIYLCININKCIIKYFYIYEYIYI